MRPLATISLALVATALTACAGPKADYEVGTQAAPVNLILGAHDTVVDAPVGPISVPLPPGLAPYFPLPPLEGPETPGVPEPELGPCPGLDPLAPVTSASPPILPGPPQPGSYQYRVKTTDTVGGKTATYTGNSTWTVTVGAVDATTGGYQVTIESAVGPAKTKRVLLMLPKAIGAGTAPADLPAGDPAAPDATDPNVQVIDGYNATVRPYGLPELPRSSPNLGRFGPAGIYLVSQTSGEGTFRPTAPIPLVQTPIANNSFTGYGTDGVTAMTFKSTVVKPRGTVNACGKKVEAVQVELSDGVLAGLTNDGKVQVVEFTETLSFGLQFGGIPIRDTGTVKALKLAGGAPAPETIERKFEFTVNAPPKPARA